MKTIDAVQMILDLRQRICDCFFFTPSRKQLNIMRDALLEAWARGYKDCADDINMKG